MLTKDLIKCKVRSNKIHPQFVNKDENLTTLARNLLGFLDEISNISTPANKTRKEIEKALLDNFDISIPIFPGLKKILFDHCVWQEDDENIQDKRWQWLLEAQMLRGRLNFASPISYQKAISEHFDKDFTQIRDIIYSDLPENKLLASAPQIDPLDLINRYNVALVQGLLLKAFTLKIKLKNLTTIQKRNFFRAIKFHQLMVNISETDHLQQDAIQITIDGPMHLFKNAGSYGDKFANFFPHILHLSNWELIAELEWKRKKVILSLSEKNNLTSHYKEKSGFIPEEFNYFIESFNKSCSYWQAKIGESFINIGSQSYCFPDIEFFGINKEKLAFELFHKWHKGQLLHRLKSLQKHSEHTMIIGVCRSISKQKEIADALNNSLIFQNNGILFRDFPTPNAVKDTRSICRLMSL
ncbi:MAG: DUF790 family protein [Bdellovibrionota bacterium]